MIFKLYSSKRGWFYKLICMKYYDLRLLWGGFNFQLVFGSSYIHKPLVMSRG